MLPEVAVYFSGKNVFVTGVTGFVGLAIVEKLLRTVPDIGTIYLLVRAKRGKTAHDRLNDIKSSSIFETIIEQGNQSALDKLKAVEGNIDADNLGLNDTDQATLISEVNIVFHCAATLDFEASLKTTVEVNLLGTRRIVELCKRMQNLKAFVHTSSAYTNADRMSADEILYPPPENKDKVIELVQTLSDQHIDEITPKLLKKHPNTYTFTKALAEHEVANAFSQVPSCIVRPSMILGVWKDPIPGWTNSKNGPQGFIMGASLGVVRRLPVGKELIYDYIPVDIVVNTIIAAAMYTATNKDQLTEIPIFQCTSSTCNPFRWSAIENLITGILNKFPATQAVWYPHLKLLPSLAIFNISAFIFHMLPAYCFDTVSRLLGVRPKLVKLHTSVNLSVERLEPFIFQEWKFDNSRTMELHNQLAPADQQLFGLDITSLSWKEFFEIMAYGVRRWLLNEKDSTLPKARKKNYMLMVSNLILQFTIFFLLVILVKSVLGLGGWQASLLVFSLLYLVCTYL